jgi:competence protein ComEC
MRAGTLAFVAGVGLAHLLRALPDVLLCLALLPVCGLVALRCARARLPALIGCGFLWCVLQAGWALQRLLPEVLEGVDLSVEGVVDDVPSRRGDRLRFILRVERATEPSGSSPSAQDILRGARIRLSWYQHDAPLHAGERWRLRVRLRQPRGRMNPGGFDFEAWALRNRLGATGYVRRDRDNARLAPASRWSLDAWREQLGRSVAARLGPRAEAPLVNALALGLRDGVSPAQWRTLRRSGTAHLMAISGLHVGLVAWLGFAIGRGLWSRSSRLSARLPAPFPGLALALVLATAYAGLAGFSVPTRRALVMLAALAAARLQRRRVPPSGVLAAAALAVLVADPLALGSPGFWLSFGAVGAILLGSAERLGPDAGSARAVHLWWRWGRVHGIVALGLAPFAVSTFGAQPLLGPVANALAVPWVTSVVVPPALAGVALSQAWPAAAGVLLELAAGALGLLWPALEIVAAAGPAARGASVPAWLAGAAVVGASLAIAPVCPRSRWLALCWLAPLFLARPPALTAGEVVVTVLDVGQGLAVVARTQHRTLVYDAGPRLGPRLDSGRSVVAPFLRARGVRRVDRLVVSHADVDHAGGVAGLRAEVDVAEVVSDWPMGGRRRVPCIPGRAWFWDGVRFALERGLERGSDNDRSCVLRIDAPGGSILVPGDAEVLAERALAEPLRRAAPVTVLVAGHHGSRTSSTTAFLDAVRPRHAAVSAGHRNRFGFPHREVVERLARRGVSILETSRCGAITYHFDGTGALPPSCWRRTARRPWHRGAGR